MVDPVRVARLLRSLTDDLAFLEAEATASPERRRDPMWLRGVKYSFVTAIEAAVDVAQHACAAQGWGPPETNADALSLLGRHGVLVDDLASSMSRASGFRTVLVHDYVRVDDDLVVAKLADLYDLRAFARQVANWLPNGSTALTRDPE